MNAPEQRHARRDQHQVGAHVGQQVHGQPAQPAVPVRRDLDPLPLVPAVVHGHVALAARLGPLDRPAELAGDQQGQHFLGRHLQLRAETAAHVRRDHPEVLLGDAGTRASIPAARAGSGWRTTACTHRRPAADHRARFHGAGDQPLLAVVALDHHRHVARTRRRCRRCRTPTRSSCCRPRAPWARPRPGPSDVQHRRQRLVVDVDRLERVRRRVPVPGHHAGHGLADVADLVDGHRRVRRDRRCPGSPARRRAGCPARQRSPRRRTRRDAGRCGPRSRPPG